MQQLEVCNRGAVHDVDMTLFFNYCASMAALWSLPVGLCPSSRSVFCLKQLGTACHWAFQRRVTLWSLAAVCLLCVCCAGG